MSKNPYFFGYGSLVNRATHDFIDAHPAQIRGWRRAWRHTNLRPVAYLTAEPDDKACIDGLVAGVPGGDWAALDHRERAYDRHPVGPVVNHRLHHEPEIAIYTIPEGRHGRPDTAHPILLSYVDVVFQGYLREFGEAGARRFAETTAGWDAPVLNDRAAPRYPRHQNLRPEEYLFVDELLRDLPVRLTSPD